VTDFEGRMALLRGRFVARAGEEAQQVESCLAAADWAKLRSLCHGLAGRAGMFGLPELGAVALKVEELIEADASAERIRLLGSKLGEQLTLVADGH
jgi:HPt (histidine-containing phosphotransfer) domain-containing protein